MYQRPTSTIEFILVIFISVYHIITFTGHYRAYDSYYINNRKLNAMLTFFFNSQEHVFDLHTRRNVCN